MGPCWATASWQTNSWQENSWCPDICTPAPIGTSWQSGTWNNDAWCQNTWANSSVCTEDVIGNVWDTASWEIVWCRDTWANRSTPIPPIPAPVIVEERIRRPGPSIIIYQEPLPKVNKRRKRENEEVIIL